jgi:hypothetical protein
VIYAVVPLVVALICLWLGRRMASALLILGYLSIEGFLKLLSNYNRIVHVGLDLIVLSLAGYLILQAIMERRAALDELPYTKLILIYGLWMFLQLLNPYSPGIIQSVAAFKIHLTMVPLYFIAATLFRTPQDVVKFLFGMTLISLIPSAMALAQYALGPASVLDLSPRFWANISYYHEWRPFGTSAVPGGASVFAFLLAPLTIALLIAPVRKSMKPIAILAILMAAATFVVSGVRQVLLGCVLTIVVMMVLMISRESRKIGMVMTLLAILGFGGYVGVATFLRPMATEAILRDPRAPEIWRQRDVTQRIFTLTRGSSYLQARDNPMRIITYRATHYPFGAGLGRTGSTLGAFKEQVNADATSRGTQADVGWTADNFFADMIVEGGIPALIMIMWILIGMMVRAVRLARRAQDPIIIPTAAALAGFYISILAMSYGSQPLLGNPITAHFWFFCGLCAAMQRIEHHEVAQREQAEALDAEMDSGAMPVGFR